ncbi:Protein C12orf4 like [Schistosoma japonicum]|nr:Protein C12orf4 like [Schistosoma japonicum]KAH8866551.1 Protein C12orf4 like [Schistosoma japonicum]
MRKALFEFSESFEHDVHVYVEEWLEFPMRLTISECVSQLASAYDIPDVALEVFHEKLSDFISNETTNDFKNPYLNLLNNLKCNMSNIENLCSIFDSSYSNETSTSKLSKMNDQEIFSRTFSQMIHSHAAQDFIHLEQSFALEIGNKFQKRNDILKEMDEKHINEIERSLQKRGSEIPETITQLQEDYYFNREIFESYWDSRISGLKWEQRQALRSFVMSYEGYANSLPINNDRVHFSRISSKDSSFKTQNSSSNRSSAISVQTISKRADRIPLSETFTAQLGRQLRTILPDDDSLAERMNNALNIYSDNLNGLVILVDKRINSFRGTKKLLADACEQSAEIHFPELGSQLESIQESVNRLGSRKLTEPNCTSTIKSGLSNENSTAVKSKPDYYEPIHGDVLITKHSNLISDTGDGIHVIFQVVVDYDNESNNIRIPHSLHCAISAILRICFDYDITTLSLPLLLVPSLSENMDKPWRAKRVEMVLKAVKGALMELITWRGFNLRSMEFLAPSCLTEEEFNVFRQIISNSFLQPNPLIAV